MSKRFTIRHENILFDNSDETFYRIDDSETNIKHFCNKLNDLNNENIQLKHEDDRYIANYQGDTIVSITDKVTNHQLNMEEVLGTLNSLEEYRLKKGKRISELSGINRLCFDVIDGFQAYIILKNKGMIMDYDYEI